MIREIIQTIISLFQWIIIVAPWEQAVRIRLGNRIKLCQSGIHFTIPFVDRVYRQTIRDRTIIIRSQTVTTKDGITIAFAGAISFAIVDLLKLLNNIDNPIDTVETMMANKAAEYITSNNIIDVTPDKLCKYVSSSIDLSRYGLGNQSFNINSFAKVKTYRFITGDFASYSYATGIDMEKK